MNNKFLAAVLAGLTIISCNSNKTKVPATKAEFEAVLSEMTESVKAGLDKTAESTAQDSIINAYYDDIKTLCKRTVKKNPDKEAAVFAVTLLESFLEPDEMEDMIMSLSEENRNKEVVQEMLSRIQSTRSTQPGQMFTDFQVSDVKFSDYIGKGKYVLVDFWASWCNPCRKEIPNIKYVYEKYAGEKFDVLSVAVWDEPEDSKAAAEEEGISWNQIIDAQKIPTDIYGIQGIPQIMLFGPDGTILKRDLRGEAVEAAVKEALGL